MSRSDRDRGDFRSSDDRPRIEERIRSDVRVKERERRERSPPKEPFKVDRSKVCPLLLRVFTKMGGHHRPEEFRGRAPEGDELQMHTWKDGSLRELTELVKEVRTAARAREARFTFCIVYPDANGK
eukprot:TRINITY_DN927_c0_g1_i6.p1 TRINITY_DN927_c0_g1~~TRINITY_DN927_c0_g1_i6.p1  ORF type:complete len:126 (-),score=17.56 TRINITY_DN927_c0_g1_i6:79-456(-)